MAAGVLVLCVLVVATFGRSVTFEPLIYKDGDLPSLKTRSGEADPVAFVQSTFRKQPAGKDWEPLTDVTLAVEAAIGGEHATVVHRIVQVGLHAGAVVLFYLLLMRWLGTRWLAFVGAALWAVHAQRLESVMWLSQRSDVLGAVLGLGAVYAMTGRDGCATGTHEGHRESRGHGGAMTSVFLLILAMLAEPLVGVFAAPVLVLFDKSVGFVRTWGLVIFGGAITACAIVLRGEPDAGILMPSDDPRGWKDGAVAVVWYVENFLWPMGRQMWPDLGAARALELTISWLVMVAMIAAAIWSGRRKDWRLAGLIVLVVTWGLAAVLWQWGSLHPVGDHLSYFIGLPLVAIVCLLLRRLRLPSVTIPAAVILISMGLTMWRAGYWRSSQALLRHQMEPPSRSEMPTIWLARWHVAAGDLGAAESALYEAESRNPNSGLATTELGQLFLQSGDRARAGFAFVDAMEKTLNEPTPYVELSRLRVEAGKIERGEKYLIEGLERFPASPALMRELGFFRLRQSQRYDSAEALFRAVLRRDARDGEAQLGLGLALIRQEDYSEGVEVLTRLLEAEPNRRDVAEYLQRELVR